MTNCWRSLGVATALILAGAAACSSPELVQAKDGKDVAAAQCTPERLPEQSPNGLALERLCVTSGKTTHAFTVEVAATPQQQARGLMFRTVLAPDAGMIFPFATIRPASFWMKNTYIPLDIIFVLPDGKIESVAAMAQPTSLDQVRSKGEVGAVFEIAGGRAAQLGLKPGDTITRPK